MQQPRIHRFDFGALRDFRGPIVVKSAVDLSQAEAAVPEPVIPTFSEEDLETARLTGKKQGYADGFSAGKIEAQKESDSKAEEANAAIAKLSGLLGDLQQRYQSLLLSESQHLSELVISIARKVAGEAMDQRGADAIIAIVERCLQVIFSKPRLAVELHPDNFERAIERIETLLREHSFEGEVQFKANPTLGASDVNLDWGNGQVSRSAEELWEEINTLITRVPLEITFAETLDTDTKPTGE